MQLRQNPHVSLSSYLLSVTCTANRVKCTLGIPIFLKIELCSCSPWGDPDKWQCRLITHPLVYLGLSLHAKLQVRSAAICCCVCGQSLCTRMFVSAGSANQEAQRRDTQWQSIVQQTQVNIHPSWRFCIARDHDSFTKTLKLHLKQDTFTLLGEDEDSYYSRMQRQPNAVSNSTLGLSVL